MKKFITTSKPKNTENDWGMCSNQVLDQATRNQALLWSRSGSYGKTSQHEVCTEKPITVSPVLVITF